ncbi:phospholipase A2 inhibitor and Ly6/PLAUR domain-containing protein-like isoform 1-T1 [Anomaloglossus baeobatrachus]|uniref:phospholipase A2 inhibitor and Ly6/PLAUR domain-containing protein-like n=1 Tax=Anomaloglossus baeobatrachus TaxID=238106 RepID=UPI003F4FE567
MKILLSIWAILAICITTGHALSCTQCSSDSSTTCQGNSETCPAGFVCRSFYFENSAGSSSLQRSCSHPRECNIKGGFTIKQVTFMMASSCCDTDNCDPPLPPSPPISSVPNGVTCPSCTTTGSTSCQSSEVIKCTGDQNRCVLLTQEGNTGSIYRGCATKEVCDLQVFSGNVLSGQKISCTNGDISIHRAVLTTTIACILLVKWLL